MTYYLLYDVQNKNMPYALLTSDGKFSSWKPIKDLLNMPITKYKTLNNIDINQYIAKPDFPIIATFDYKPTAKTNPELFI